MLSLFKRQVAVTGAPLMRVSFSSGFTALKKAEKDATKTTKTTKPPKTGKAAIKRPITAYAAYVADYYKQYKPAGSAVDFAQEMAAKWRNLSDAAKQPFYEINKQDSERYHAEVDAYEKTLPPKRPSNSFIRYLLDHRANFVKENPGASMVEVGKIAGAAWKKLSDAEKKPYQDAFAKAKAEYEAKHKSSD